MMSHEHKEPVEAQEIDLSFTGILPSTLYSLKQAASVAGVSPQTLRRWIDIGSGYSPHKVQLAVVKVGKRRYVRLADLSEFKAIRRTRSILDRRVRGQLELVLPLSIRRQSSDMEVRT